MFNISKYCISLVLLLTLVACNPYQGMYNTEFYPGSAASGPGPNYCPKPKVDETRNAVDIVKDEKQALPVC